MNLINLYKISRETKDPKKCISIRSTQLCFCFQTNYIALNSNQSRLVWFHNLIRQCNVAESRQCQVL